METYTLPATAQGLALAYDLAVSLRRGGFKTRLVEHSLGRFEVVTLVATFPPRLSRKERGL